MRLGPAAGFNDESGSAFRSNGTQFPVFEQALSKRSPNRRLSDAEKISPCSALPVGSVANRAKAVKNN